VDQTAETSLDAAEGSIKFGNNHGQREESEACGRATYFSDEIGGLDVLR
jgi:hypothetical protein